MNVIDAVDEDTIDGYYQEAQLFKRRINQPIYTLHTLDHSSAYRVIKEWCESNNIKASRKQVNDAIGYFNRAILGLGNNQMLATTVTMLRLCYSAVTDFVDMAEKTKLRYQYENVPHLGSLYSLANANMRVMDQIDLEINQYLHLCFNNKH